MFYRTTTSELKLLLICRVFYYGLLLSSSQFTDFKIYIGTHFSVFQNYSDTPKLVFGYLDRNTFKIILLHNHPTMRNPGQMNAYMIPRV